MSLNLYNFSLAVITDYILFDCKSAGPHELKRKAQREKLVLKQDVEKESTSTHSELLVLVCTSRGH